MQEFVPRPQLQGWSKNVCPLSVQSSRGPSRKSRGARANCHCLASALRMWGNRIGDEGAKAFAEALRNHPSLTNLRYILPSETRCPGASGLSREEPKGTGGLAFLLGVVFVCVIFPLLNVFTDV